MPSGPVPDDVPNTDDNLKDGSDLSYFQLHGYVNGAVNQYDYLDALVDQLTEPGALQGLTLNVRTSVDESAVGLPNTEVRFELWANTYQIIRFGTDATTPALFHTSGITDYVYPVTQAGLDHWGTTLAEIEAELRTGSLGGFRAYRLTDQPGGARRWFRLKVYEVSLVTGVTTTPGALKVKHPDTGEWLWEGKTAQGRFKVLVDGAWKYAEPVTGENGGFGLLKVKLDDGTWIPTRLR